MNYLEKFIYQWSAYETATSRVGECESLADCKGTGNYCVAGTCILGEYVSTHDALSPAFHYNHDDKTYSIVDNDLQYPQWVEA